jgi:hypothetical protein
MATPDPDELTIAAAYPDRMLLFSWKPDQPGVRVVVAPAGDAPDAVVELAQDRDTDAVLRRLRRILLRLPAEVSTD